MPSFERGVYEPKSDDVRVFDEDEQDIDEEGSRLPLLIVIALLVLAAFGGVVWLAYSQGVQRGRADAPDSDSVPPPPTEVTKPAPAPMAAKPVEKPAALAPKPTEVAKVPAKPMEKPAATATKPAPTKPAEAKPAVSKAIETAALPPPAVAPTASKPAEAAASAGGAYVLQIGSYKSQADADAAWKTFSSKHPMAGGYSENVRKADLGDKGTWYRLRMGSFADKAAASGTELAAEERDFFHEIRPWGFILFGRNIESPAQIKRLVAALRATVNDPSAPVLIDQEGGRVARLKPPQWKERPTALRFAELHATAPEEAREAAYLNARLIAQDLTDLGINVDCLPVLDVPVEGAHDIIGDRAYGRDPSVIIDLGRAVIEGMIEGGVLPVMKHIPGHGRAGADSHLALPRVSATAEELSATDFVTFRSLNSCPLAMTAHVVYEAIDAQRPATTSSGSLAHRAKASLFAGCDVVLHCNGNLAEMREISTELKPLEDIHLKRAGAALAHLSTPAEFDIQAGEARLAALLGTRS